VNYVGENENQEFESLEQKVFKALDNQKRRDILRYIGEKKATTFTEILNVGKIADSPTLSYHLRNLAPFIKQEAGKYCLTPLGKDAYNLLLRTATYDKLAFLRKNKSSVTLGNIVIWIAAIAAAAALRADAMLSSIILPVLAAVSLYITNKLFE